MHSVQRQQIVTASAEQQEKFEATLMSRKQRIKTSQATTKGSGPVFQTTKSNLTNKYPMMQTMDQNMTGIVSIKTSVHDERPSHS